MPPQIIVAIGAIEAFIRIAPGVVDIAKKLKELIASLFTNKIITKEEQDALMARIDQVSLESISGSFPDWWKVDPDPVDADEDETKTDEPNS